MSCFAQDEIYDTTLSVRMKGAKMDRIENGVPIFKISMSRLRKLETIECSDKSYKVESFIFVYGGKTFTIAEHHIKGNSFELCFKDLASAGIVSLFYLEQIVTVDANGKKRILRPIKVLVI